MLYCSYRFEIPIDGSYILFDNEVSADEMYIQDGWEFVASVGDDGALRLVRVNYSKEDSDNVSD